MVIPETVWWKGKIEKAEEEVKIKEHRCSISLLIAANGNAYVALNNRYAGATPNKSIPILGGSNWVKDLWDQVQVPFLQCINFKIQFFAWDWL